MSESKIEHVARAMKTKLSADDGEVYFRDDGGTCLVDGHVDLNALARVAIEAMREPTDAMCSAPEDNRTTGARRSYQAMIDVALNEQVSG